MRRDTEFYCDNLIDIFDKVSAIFFIFPKESSHCGGIYFIE